METKLTFKELGLSEWILNHLKSLGFNKPTPVQRNCITPILSGEGCMGCSKTGTGKTAAFALPILQKLSEDPYGIYCLVLTPTRELAYQISEQFALLGKPINVRTTVVVGGMDSLEQAAELKRKPHIVIATPGRLADHIRNSENGVNFRKMKFLVLDEADRLLDRLDGDFGDDLDVIFNILPKKRQTLLFSATLTDTLKEVQDLNAKKPFVWSEPKTVSTVDELDQRYVLIPEHVKDGYLVFICNSILESSPNHSIMIFTKTCKNCQIIAMLLRSAGFDCTSLHSLMSQRSRLDSLSKFKSSGTRLLIATDVAARGLDIPLVQTVINHNIPGAPKTYIHRVGRTARAGRSGMSISLVTQFDIHRVQAIEEVINTKLKDYEVEENAVLKILTKVNVMRREIEIKLEENDFGERRKLNKRKAIMREGMDPDEEKKQEKRLKFERRKRERKLRMKQGPNKISST
uniref:probable ATP-dependent RNA helicase DDX49 n=1 Tax=Styela clava TaxID=7725 RepID=UPI00193A7198|nr:probable ATP-dependent RNA helicase DDX49 [Styela clava]